MSQPPTLPPNNPPNDRLTLLKLLKKQHERTTNRNEEIEQARLIKWTHKREVRALIPQLAYIHHSPNGGKRSAFTGAQMKAMGTSPGFPDLVLPAITERNAGLAIEMKSSTGKATDQQNDWLLYLAAQGWDVHISRSAEDARDIIAAYFGITPANLPALA